MSDERMRQELDWVATQPAARWAAPAGKSIAVVYSGYQGKNFDRAKDDCAKEGSPRYRIEQTAAGKELDEKNLYDKAHSGLTKEEADAVLDAASAKFAEQIVGPVETNIVSSDRERIARRTEVPGLENATSINGIAGEDFAGLSERERYYAIAESEVSLARDRAAVDPELSTVVHEKEKGLNAVYARDMSADAQRLASQSTTPAQEEPVEVPHPANDNEKHHPANDNKNPHQANDNKKPDSLDGPRDDVPMTAGQKTRDPGPIPRPNESFKDLMESTKASMPGSAAPPVPGPSDDIPVATAAPPIANDNSVPGLQ